MMLDAAIYGLSCFLLAWSMVTNKGRAAISVVCLSLLFDRYLYSPTMTFDHLLYWSIALSAKDCLFIFILGIRQQIKELPLLVSFSISCLLHQIIVIEVYNRDLTLFYLRPDIMSVLVSAMLASVIFIQITGGGHNGGKRSVNYRFLDDSRLFNLLYIQTSKASK